MAFKYDKQIQATVDVEKQVTIRIAEKFLDVYPQPFEVMTEKRSFYINYETESEQRSVVLKNGDIYEYALVVALRLDDWNVKCEFVRQMHGHLTNPLPERIRLGESAALFQGAFEELQRLGFGKGYEALKAVVMEGVRSCWTAGEEPPDLRVEFIEWLPSGLPRK